MPASLSAVRPARGLSISAPLSPARREACAKEGTTLFAQSEEYPCLHP